LAGKPVLCRATPCRIHAAVGERWNVASEVVIAWVLTLPAAAGVAALAYAAASLLA